MQRSIGLLLSVWREACSQIAISESACRITPLLCKRLPLQLLRVSRIDLKRTALQTVAEADATGARGDQSAATPCTRRQLDELLNWGRVSELRHWPAGNADPARAALAPDCDACEAIAGPLRVRDQLAGFLVLAAKPGHTFDDVQREFARELLAPFAAALENDRTVRELTTLREAAEADRRALLARLGRSEISESIVGADTGLRSVMERVTQVARADVPVLLFGETGSGKEVVARAIHVRSDRHDGPFHRVNCGAIAAELVDSELFGHERGSFTGATSTRKGWFERADGGTLFLDEIGELPLSAQVRLLRVTQDGTFERVGGQRQLHVDVRIVAATHRNLQSMVTAGQFREDLWYRLAVFPIQIPPLRERPDDLPALAAHFATRASRRFGLPLLMPTLDDIDLLGRYSWPGNIRELAAVIDRAAILGNGDRLEIAKSLGLTPSGQPTGASNNLSSTIPTPDSPPSGAQAERDQILPLDIIVRRHIEATLRLANGRIEGHHGIARMLDINPHTLRARMRKLGIDWSRFRHADR